MYNIFKLIAATGWLGLLLAMPASAKPLLLDLSSADFYVPAGSKSIQLGQWNANAFGASQIWLAHEAGQGLGVASLGSQDSRVDGAERIGFSFATPFQVAGIKFSDLFAGQGTQEIARVRIWDDGDNLVLNQTVYGASGGEVELALNDITAAKRLVINTVSVGGVLGTGGNFFVSGIRLSQPETVPVAEPGMLAIVGLGLVLLGGLRRRHS